MGGVLDSRDVEAQAVVGNEEPGLAEQAKAVFDLPGPNEKDSPVRKSFAQMQWMVDVSSRSPSVSMSNSRAGVSGWEPMTNRSRGTAHAWRALAWLGPDDLERSVVSLSSGRLPSR